MITKVTSANYDAYTLLFNQADAALKEYNGEPTSEFVQVDKTTESFDDSIQYFDADYQPLSDVTATNYATYTEDLYKLNEQVIYDLDTYFGRLKLLSEIDYSFLKLPLDEPTFDILDDSASGRRIISVPEDFAKNGISVQGDETAEILFFSIDRYYDSTDLWQEGMQYAIQWKNGTKNGVTKAFVNKDGRPFIDKTTGKLYFGWPISSEITDIAGNVVFSVRIYKFNSQTDEDETPTLAFGLNTQTGTVKINESLAFSFVSETEFDGAETVSKSSDLVGRIVNSTVLSKEAVESAPIPTMYKNILTSEELAERISEKTIESQVYVLATEAFDENETYYNIEHEEVTGLNENIYRANIYYTKETITQKYYEFDAEDIIDKIDQIQALVSSGIITYTAHSQATPEDTSAGGSYEFRTGDAIVYVPVTSATRLANHKYYEYDSSTQKYKVALNIETSITDETWKDSDKNLSVSGNPCKYYERISPKLIIDEDNPIGCYWIVANNNEGKKALSTIDSYRIWIPGPIDLTEANINDTDKDYDLDDFERVIINSTTKKGSLVLNLQNIPANNEVKYEWYKKVGDNYVIQSALSSANSQDITYTEDQLALADDKYKVSCYSYRNKKASTTKISRTFRITDQAHKFIFDTTADTDSEVAHPTDNIKVISKLYTAENADKFKIDFSENITNNQLNILSDKIAYRFRQRAGGDIASENIFYNDSIPSNWKDEENNLTSEFKLTTYSDLKDIEFTIPEVGKWYYVELINIVNEDFDLDDLNTKAAAMQTTNGEMPPIAAQDNWAIYEERIARTPYYYIES